MIRLAAVLAHLWIRRLASAISPKTAKPLIGNMVDFAWLSRRTAGIQANGFHMAFVGQLATWSVFLLLAWISVRLFWRITLTTVPAPVVAIETQPLRLAEKLKGVQWFGVSPSPQMQIQAAPNFSLRGLIGTSGSRALGMAIFVIDNKSQKVVREGEEISPGCVLDKVTPDGVQIQRNGIREFLPIPKRAG